MENKFTEKTVGFEELSYLTEEKYESFLESVNYNSKDVGEENKRDIKLCPKDFFLKHLEKIREANPNKPMTGCCLNFCSCLLTQYNGMLLTCSDTPGTHVAFVYPKNGELYVCDPAVAKIKNDGNLYFDIPLKDYHFREDAFTSDRPQEYKLFPNIRRDTESVAFINLIKSEKHKYTYSNLADIDDNELEAFKDVLQCARSKQ